MISKIGTAAGLVWNALNESSTPMSYEQLKRATKLTDTMFYLAIGWLAREDKVWYNNECYSLK